MFSKENLLNLLRADPEVQQAIREIFAGPARPRCGRCGSLQIGASGNDPVGSYRCLTCNYLGWDHRMLGIWGTPAGSGSREP